MNADRILKGLLQYNYFPSQKKDEEELPPVINSKDFNSDVANQLCAISPRKNGYDQIEYRVTRFNNVSRILSIPHPLPYALLCNEIFKNWGNINYITETETSLISPDDHGDGRIIIMDYESSKEKIERHIENTFNKKFIVETDIANFFPSVYSHAIPWALVGFDFAKSHRDPLMWFNKIDAYNRSIKRGETNGVPIGPAVSNILSEIILVRVDEKLEAEGFEFIRFIDDYTGYFDTYEDAEKFVRLLSEELSVYKLYLNAKKTTIDPLPSPTSAEWIIDLNTRLPTKENLYPSNVVRFLDYAVRKQSANPDGSVVKYAAISIISLIKTIPEEEQIKKTDLAKLVIKYLIGLCIKYPVVIPLLQDMFKVVCIDSFPYEDQILKILNNHTINRRSDAMSWSIYYLRKYSDEISDAIAEDVIKTKDCISILQLYLTEQHESKIMEFYKGLQNGDCFLLDQYWLLLYQMFKDKKIENPYKGKGDDEEVFQILSKKKIDFVTRHL